MNGIKYKQKGGTDVPHVPDEKEVTKIKKFKGGIDQQEKRRGLQIRPSKLGRGEKVGARGAEL